MKQLKRIIILLSFGFLSSIYAQSLSDLQRDLDSLKLKLKEHELFNEMHARGRKLDWGSGFFMAGKTGAENSTNIELGYLWKTGSNPSVALSENYIGERSDYRYGFSIGAQYFKNDLVFKKDNEFYKSTAYSAFGKFHFASPVLLNFISFSCHLKAMYVDPTDNNKHKIRTGRMAYGFGYDVDFWLTETECASIGFTSESDTFINEHKDDSIYPSKIRFVFGYKMFF